jgi:hypothetical protein
MVADELADHQARPSPAVLRPVGSGLWAPDMLNRGPAASTADLGLRESGQRKDSQQVKHVLASQAFQAQ